MYTLEFAKGRAEGFRFAGNPTAPFLGRIEQFCLHALHLFQPALQLSREELTIRSERCHGRGEREVKRKIAVDSSPKKRESENIQKRSELRVAGSHCTAQASSRRRRRGPGGARAAERKRPQRLRHRQPRAPTAQDSTGIPISACNTLQQDRPGRVRSALPLLQSSQTVTIAMSEREKVGGTARGDSISGGAR